MKSRYPKIEPEDPQSVLEAANRWENTHRYVRNTKHKPRPSVSSGERTPTPSHSVDARSARRVARVWDESMRGHQAARASHRRCTRAISCSSARASTQHA
eukprot:3906522-Rhodomonas_salina.1